MFEDADGPHHRLQKDERVKPTRRSEHHRRRHVDAASVDVEPERPSERPQVEVVDELQRRTDLLCVLDQQEVRAAQHLLAGLIGTDRDLVTQTVRHPPEPLLGPDDPLPRLKPVLYELQEPPTGIFAVQSLHDWMPHRPVRPMDHSVAASVPR